ncbi:MAG TPA: hypothetical protein VM265_04905 [Sphingomicrobium sp.]|nr:hypothetical protein [Sphingomicrobium sp.]
MRSREEYIEAAFGSVGQPYTADVIFEHGESGTANAVLAIALVEQSLSTESRAILKVLYEALSGQERDWRLLVKRRRRGRKLTLIEQDELAARDTNDVALLEWATKAYGKREAAIAFMGQFGRSRASIFAALKRVRRREESTE